MKNKITILILAVVASGLFGYGLYYARELISIGVAYKTKMLCSGIFVSKRSEDSILINDLLVDDLAALRFINSEVDHARQTVSSNFYGFLNQKAVYLPGFGCTLEFAGYEHQNLMALHRPAVNSQPSQWLEGQPKHTDSKFINQAALQKTLDWAFSEPNPERLRRTRAIVVIHDGHIVAERYAPGFNQNTPLIGWSMTKSVMHALTGILVRQGKFKLASPLQAQQWWDYTSPKHSITLDNLLTMTTGLEFNEDSSNPLADVTRMLLREPNMASFAASKDLIARPGAQWRYSSGTSNILSGVLRRALGDKGYPLFPREALFKPLDMDSAVLELDASGTFVGSSYMYASARDWAKIGLLYLLDGVWNGQRILPEGWVRYATTPVVQADNQAFGAHFWLKIPAEYATGGDAKHLPKDTFHAIGHEGQFITVIPSYNIVTVRLGLTRYASAWQHDTFVRKVIESLGH